MIKIEITTSESFFESTLWLNDISKHIVQDLGNVLPYSNHIKRKYNIDISTTTLMQKAKELQYAKPKTKIPKNKMIRC